MDIRGLLVHDFDEKDIKSFKEEDYDPEELEESKERALPFLGGLKDKDQAITPPNASASTNANNIKKRENSDDEEDEILSKLSPSDNQFSFGSVG